MRSCRKAVRLCNQVDEHDTMFVAATLFIEGFLWTGDKKLRKGLRENGFYKTIILVEKIISLFYICTRGKKNAYKSNN